MTKNTASGLIVPSPLICLLKGFAFNGRELFEKVNNG
jgi:hypothetical protein